MNIYPKYEITIPIGDGLHFETYVRKKDNNGIWRLIPLKVVYFVNHNSDMRLIYDDFHNTCYRMLINYDFNKIIRDPSIGMPLESEVDPGQLDESLRINPWRAHSNVNIL